MFKHALPAVLVSAALGGPAQAADPAEVERLRVEFDQKIKALQAEYESRLKALEARLAEQASAPAPARPAASRGNAFNPEVSLTLQGSYAQREGGEHHLTGFLTGADHEHGGERGFRLDHTELTLAADIDSWLRGYANLALIEDAVEVEEAWFQTLGLGNGFTLKGGRFLSGIGYANEQHPHAWDFAENSLMYTALFGESFGQDGLQLKWLAPTETFIELGAEIGRGSRFPGSESGGDRNGTGAWAAFAHVGGDLGDSSSWRAGLSYLHARPIDRASHVEDASEIEAEARFTGKSKTWIADLVWKWAPDGNPKARNLKLQAEYFQRDEAGDLSCLANGNDCTGQTDAYHAATSGWYVQGVYQFAPRWRIGLRYDRLDSGNPDIGVLPIELPDYQPSRWSLMADYSPSEFSRFRVQYARDHGMQGDPDDSQVTVQYIHSLGAHGGHKF